MKAIYLSALLVFLGACASAPDTRQSDLWLAKDWIAEEANTAPPVAQWWHTFDDPVLVSVIDQALEANYDIRMAQARVRQARAVARLEQSDGWPQLTASGSAQRISASENAPGGLSELADAGLAELEQDVFQAGLDASWELDLFGGNRSESRAALARLGGAQSAYNDVLIRVLAEVALNYVELRGVQQRLIAMEGRIANLEQIRGLIEVQRASGLASESDLLAAIQRVEQTRAQEPALRGAVRTYIFRLSVLTGQPPDALLGDLKADTGLPLNPDIVPVGLRSDLLLRRPDLRIARFDLESALADRDAAEADLYPKFFLTGSAGYETITFGDLLDPASATWTLGGLVQWPIFQRGQIRANIRARDAAADAAALGYEVAVLHALEDVEGSLYRYGQALNERSRMIAGYEAAKSSAILVQNLAESGLRSKIQALTVQAQSAAAKDLAIQSEVGALSQLIGLYKALGGGWP